MLVFIFYFFIFSGSLAFLVLSQQQPRKQIVEVGRLRSLFMKHLRSCRGKKSARQLASEAESRVAGYKPSSAASLKNFNRVKRFTQCLFARNAKLWGSHPYDPSISLRDNVLKSLPAFIEFTRSCDVALLDGFVIEVPGPCEFTESVEGLARALCIVLETFASNDPSGCNCLLGKSPETINSAAWSFRFGPLCYFVTSFSPVYGVDQPRHSFGASSAFFLFQPDTSFARHNVFGVSPEPTNWSNPQSMRDKIRVNFMRAGRGYDPVSEIENDAEVMVHPLVQGGESPRVNWWKHLSKTSATKVVKK